MKNAAYVKGLKDVFFEANKAKKAEEVTHLYSFHELQALRDMAKNEVYPDGRFSDMDCNVWSMFHLAYLHQNEE